MAITISTWGQAQYILCASDKSEDWGKEIGPK
jgi:hypothetical protein